MSSKLTHVPFSKLAHPHARNHRAPQDYGTLPGGPVSDIAYPIVDEFAKDAKNNILEQKDTKDGLVISFAKRGWAEGALKVMTLDNAAEVFGYCGKGANDKERAAGVEKLLKDIEKDRKRLIALWARGGDLPELSAAEQADNKAVESRKSLVSGIKGMAVKAQKIWFDAKTGKMNPVEYVANEGFRRSIAIIGALSLAPQAAAPFAGKDDMAVNIEVVHFDNEADALESHVAENLQKNRGTVLPGLLSGLRTAQQFFRVDATGGLSRLTRAGYTYGTAQKLWGVVQLDNKYDSFRIIERCFAPKTLPSGAANPEYLPVGSFDKEATRRLRDSLPADSKDGNQPLARSAAEKEVGAYLSKVTKGKGTTIKAVAGTEMTAIADSSKNDLLAHLLRLLAAGDKVGAQALCNDVKLAAPVNAAWEKAGGKPSPKVVAKDDSEGKDDDDSGIDATVQEEELAATAGKGGRGRRTAKRTAKK